MDRRRLLIVGKVITVLVIAVVLQIFVVSQVSVLGVTADLFLVLTIIVAVTRGPLEAALFGFVAGLVADTAYLQPLGIRALVYVLTGYFAGLIVARLAFSGPWGVALLAGVASFVAQFVFGLFQFVMGPRAAFLTMLGTQMLPEAVLDGLLTAPLYVFLVRLRLLPPAPSEPSRSGGGLT
jgi:rod shape-determining protein MreD